MDKFTIKKDVYYHDTDSGGVVYYANYLKFFEEARTEHFKVKGINLKELSARGIIFAVASIELKYKSPARYGDELSVLSRIDGIRAASMLFYHEISRGGILLVEGTARLVSIGMNFRPLPFPRDIAELLAQTC